VLGIDPGSRFLGFGVVEPRHPRLLHVASGVLQLDVDAPLAERLQQIFLQLGQVLRRFQPTAVAVEGVFTHRNPRSALILGHARGVALLLAAQAGVPVFEYAPARVKRSVGAGGNDSKESVARMVSALLRLEAPLRRADAYDALAVAVCHLGQVKAGVPLARPGRRGSGGDFTARLRPAVVLPRGAA
jgi:crossover junction endodeoxyribonuclease RuvC